ncbi:hypothetical protein F5148DRAFT_258228 [Russula earlei]|uniref:Uncharacterized protein n=1 Tax=Russula earlei TaxID=71964 RepID=A0ACC0U4G6_9AGAM|nr:hypothetical protein F5148DRAFT_258228 [Russula earlei]
MAIPLRKVSENIHLTLKRARIATDFSPFHDVPELLGGHTTVSSRTGPPGIPAVVENGYRSRSSFTPFPLESLYPPGLYIVVVHNGPLRRRIQDHLDEIEEFKACVRRARKLLFGWLVTSCHFVLVMVRYTLETTTRRLALLYGPRIRAGILRVGRLKQAVSRGYNTFSTSRSLVLRRIGRAVVDWLLHALLAIWNIALEAIAIFKRDMKVKDRPLWKNS